MFESAPSSAGAAIFVSSASPVHDANTVGMQSVRAVRVLDDERRAGRVPRRVAAGLEGGADAAAREARRVGLALDQLLAGELRRSAVPSPTERRNESCFSAVEPVSGWNQCVKCVAPFSSAQSFIAEGDRVGELGVERLAAVDRGLELAEDRLRQALALLVGSEDVGPVDLGAPGWSGHRSRSIRSGSTERRRRCSLELRHGAEGPPLSGLRQRRMIRRPRAGAL